MFCFQSYPCLSSTSWCGTRKGSDFSGGSTLQETNISPKNGIFEDDFPFPQVGYVNPLEGI